MGSFNVACSASGLSIHDGDKVVFIPLIRKDWDLRKWPGHEHHEVGTHSHLIYSNCYFNPVTLPIKGIYGDYGNVENIVQDANTKAIEKFFMMKAEDFISTIERNWCREYMSDQKEISRYFVKNYKEFNNLSDDELTEKFMLKIGFEKYKEKYYTFRDYPYMVEIKAGERKEGYIIYKKDTEKKAKTREYNGYYKNYFFSDFAELTGYYLGIAEEHQEKIHIMENMSGMYIHGEVYEYLAKGCNQAEAAPSEEMLLKLGFIKDDIILRRDDDKVYYHPEVEDQKAYVLASDYGSPCVFDKDTKDKYWGNWLHSSYELAENYIEKHGVVLDLRPFEKESSHMPNFRKVQKSIQDWKERKKLEEKLKKDKDNKKLIELMSSCDYVFSHPLNRMNTRTTGLWAFEEWPLLKDIYAESFEDGSIADAYCEWHNARDEMYSVNVFFFPAMNGEQCGNDPAQLGLHKKAVEILMDREREYQAENLCDRCLDPDCNWDCKEESKEAVIEA